MTQPDFESIALGLPQIRQHRRGDVSKVDHVALSPQEQATAASLPNSLNYSVILKIMEGELEKLETLHMQSWKDKELFERTGMIAVSARTLYEQLQTEVNYHAMEFQSELAAEQLEREVEALTPEDMIRKAFSE